MKILDFLHNTKTQAYLSLVILVGGGSIIAFCKLPDNDKNRLFDIMLLTASFYFGSSKSGATKDETIANLASTNQPSITDSSTNIITK